MRTFLAIAAGALALLAVPARAAATDAVVATAERPTTVDAFAGRAVWSTWDPTVHAYRLTEYVGGRVRTLPVAPNRVPFDVDLGPGAGGGTLAVYSRCKRPPLTTWALNGRRGCDLHAYDFARARELRVTGANSHADEYWPTVWRSRIAFTRTYTPRHGRTRRLLYWRPLEGGGPSRRLDRGPTHDDAIPEALDLNGRRVAFVWSYEYGAQVRLDTTAGQGRLLVRVPGSGAAASQLDAQGPTVVGGAVYWALAVSGATVSTDIRSHDLATGRNRRATTPISADPKRARATAGFAQDRGASWYVRDAAPDRYEIRVATGLTYEPAPPIVLD